ncbi:MAG: hypothetical protein U1F43_28585 [Myxococcota bacterium]
MPSHRALISIATLSLALGAAAPAARAWNSDIDPAGPDAWMSPWDDEHRQIAFAALAAIGAARYGDRARAPSLAPGSPYVSYRTDQPRGKCTIDGARRPGLTGRTPGGGFCLLDLARWWAGIDPTNAPLQVFLSRRADATTGDDVNTPLEERYLPDMDHFDELPDSEYSLGDWLLKDSYCPPRPSVTEQYGFGGCHDAKGYLGAGTNSSHFGEEARLHWQRYHRIALRLADRAAALRRKLDLTRPEQAQVVEEAEREALTYEGIAGHFLADRWAAGHMFNRLGSPDASAFQDLAVGGPVTIDGFYANFVAGAFTGLFHGAQEKATYPLPTSSPGIVIRYVDGDPPAVVRRLLTATELFGSRNLGPDPFAPCGKATPCDAKVDGLALTNLRLAGATHDAVGDFRWLDLVSGAWAPNDFEHRTTHPPLMPGGDARFPLGDTAFQRASLLACMSRSQAEVIRRFGPHDGGGFGLQNALIPETVGGPIEGEATCFDLWLTNKSLGRAIAAAGLTSLPDLARAHVVLIDPDDHAVTELLAGALGNLVRAGLTAEVADIIGQSVTDPTGTSLAHDLPPLLGVTAHPQSIAGFAEPEDLDLMPAVHAEQVGRSQRIIYGAFNRAHADYWCRQIDTASEDRSPLRGAAPFRASVSDNRIPIQALRRPAYEAPADDAARDALDRNEAVCELMAARIFHKSVTLAYTCGEFGCSTSYVPFEQLDPLCDAVLGEPVEQGADDPAVGYSAGYAPAYDDDEDTLPVAGDDVALDPDRGYPQTVVGWCEAKPAITNAALRIVSGQRQHRYVLSNFTPTLEDLEKSPDWAPTYYLSGSDKVVTLRGYNFGRKLTVTVQNIDTGVAKFFAYDADEAPASDNPDDDLLARGAWFHIQHDVGSELDEIQLRLIDFAPGEYDIRISNNSDGARPRLSVATTRLRVACDPADDFPGRAGATLTASGDSCGCADPDVPVAVQRGGSSVQGDRYVCEVDPCAAVYAACGKAPLHGDVDPGTANARRACYSDFFSNPGCGGSCCLCLLWDIPGAC